MRVKHARNTRDSRGNGERYEPELCDVYAHGLRRYIVIAHRHARTTGTGVYKVHKNDHTDHQHLNDQYQICILRRFLSQSH